jgi:putative ABC transport system permease protein
VGIQKENILYLPVRGELGKQYEVFKNLLLKDPEIKSVTISSHLPTGIGSNGGGYKWQGKPPEVDPLVSNTTVDGDYAATFGISMLEGEFFENTQVNDTNHVVINKAFADIIGLQPILGEVIEVWGLKLKVIGVTENFHFKPLSMKIEPLAMFCLPNYQNHIFCRIVSDDIRETIRRIEKVHNQINDKFPFEYHFLDAEYDNLYVNEQRQGTIFNIFSILAIFISCLGLFGLSSFMMAQRTKEIGIRKAHGARVLNIMTLFTRYFIKWVVVSFLIALPVSYYFTHTWLKNYAYRTAVTWWVFAAAGLMALLIAVITVSWQSWKSANKNPVEALRYE